MITAKEQTSWATIYDNTGLSFKIHFSFVIEKSIYLINVTVPASILTPIIFPNGFIKTDTF